jgi:CHAD domain-containing protein
MAEFSQFGPFRRRLEAFQRDLPGFELGHVEALHRTRVASRRLREVLPLVKLGPGISRKLDRRLRKVTKQLGNVRELDVLLRLIGELPRSPRYSQAAMKEISIAVGHARDAARGRLISRLPTAKLERLAKGLERAVEPFDSYAAAVRVPGANGKARAWLWALDARLARRAASVRSAIEVAGSLYVSGRLHDVRVALKKLRYAAELSLEVGRRVAADLAALKRAQGVLGRLHDLEVLLAWAREVQAAPSPPGVLAWKELGAAVHAIEDDCRQLHARYMRDRRALLEIASRMGAAEPDATTPSRRATG